MTGSTRSDEGEHRAEVRALLARPSSSGRLRFLVSLGAGALVVVALSVASVPGYGVVVGLMSTAAVYVVWSYLALRGFDGPATKAHARQEDTGAALSTVGGLVVIVADLGAVVTLLVVNTSKGAQTLDALLAVTGVLLSWFLLHTLYVARYAGLYYREDPTAQPADSAGAADHEGHEPAVIGGIDFNASGYWPTYGDFTYFAYNLGMTFQVSDTSVSDPRIRRLVLHHCLLSYFFSTGITASVINLVVGLAT